MLPESKNTSLLNLLNAVEKSNRSEMGDFVILGAESYVALRNQSDNVKKTVK